jgi:hypothetical protein
MFPLKISHDKINSAVDIVPFRSLNMHHRVRFEILAAVMRSAEHACFVTLEVQIVSVYGGNVRRPWLRASLCNVAPYSVFEKYSK